MANLRKIVSGPIGATDAFDPAVSGLDFRVPAIAGVVSHLVVHVLPESDSIWRDANLTAKV